MSGLRVVAMAIAIAIAAVVVVVLVRPKALLVDKGPAAAMRCEQRPGPLVCCTSPLTPYRLGVCVCRLQATVKHCR